MPQLLQCNVAEYFCIEGLVKIVDEEIEKTEKDEALRLEHLKRVDENWKRGSFHFFNF